VAHRHVSYFVIPGSGSNNQEPGSFEMGPKTALRLSGITFDPFST
jgi:hypothetical protein